MDEGSSVIKYVKNDIKHRVTKAIDKAKQKADLPSYVEIDIKINIPSRPDQGDFATGVAMALASEVKSDGKSVAGAIVRHLELEGSWIQRVDIAGPGFLNFFLSTGWLEKAMAEIWKKGPAYGRTAYGDGRKILLEFVSANPTGPLNVVNARAAAIGDCLASLLEACGYKTAKEFYVNDAGHQVNVLANSLEVRYRQQLGEDMALPENGYHGEYLVDMAKELCSQNANLLELPQGERHDWFKNYAVSHMVAMQKQTLIKYGLEYDTWFSEENLRQQGSPEATIEQLAQKGYLYEKDGATWLRSTEFGDDKDRVLIKSDGEMTYLVPDIAYHKNKLERGYDLLIDIFGPDHHGYVNRLRAGIAALGYPKESLEVIIAQTVRLVRGGQVAKMSKRGGRFISMDELLEEAGTDACRFFFLMRAPSSHLDFDLDLARLQSNENPVYYVQYAHARIASIFRQAKQDGFVPALGPNEIDFSLLVESAEIQLMKLLAAFPEEVHEIAEAREPNRLINYMMNVASAFHSFYTQCRVLGDDKHLSAARLYIARVCQIVLANALKMAGVSAPESM